MAARADHVQDDQASPRRPVRQARAARERTAVRNAKRPSASASASASVSPRIWGQLRGDGEEASDDGSEARDIPTVQPLSEGDLLLLEWLPDDGEAGGEALEKSCFPAFPPECKRLCARQALDYLLETHKISRESLIALICGIDPLPLQRLDLDQLLREPSSALLRIDLAHLLSYEK